jgi:hypothetical protein
MNPNRRALASGLLALLLLLPASLAHAQTPTGQLISYQGRLTDASGATATDGSYGVNLTILQGPNRWTLLSAPVAVRSGVFTAFLDLGDPPVLVFDPKKLYQLEVEITSKPPNSNLSLGRLAPHDITSVPMAQVAKDNVRKSGDTMTGDLDMGGNSITGLRLVFGVPNQPLDISTQGDQADLLLQSLRSGTTYIGAGTGGHQDLWVSGKGSFNGGVYSDMRQIADSIAISGEGHSVGVRGYSPDWNGVFGETLNGDAVQARVNATGGTVFRGRYQGTTVVRIDKDGKGFFNGGTQLGGQDYADLVTVKGRSSDYEPGDVMVISDDPARPFARSAKPYARNVAGIYSTKPGVLGSKRGIADPADNEIPLALTGIVPCKVSCENGPIRMGDPLVTSSTPGYAMKGTDPRRMVGAIVGKALQPLAKGRGVIEVLVTLR